MEMWALLGFGSRLLQILEMLSRLCRKWKLRFEIIALLFFHRMNRIVNGSFCSRTRCRLKCELDFHAPSWH